MSQKLNTICVQGGYTPKNGEPRILPIYQSTTYKYDSIEQMGRLFDLSESGYFYTRLQNPTNDAVAAKICALEGGAAAMLTSSGQAATFYSLFNICGEGDHIVASSAIYGGSFNLISVTMAKMGIESTFVHPDCTAEELAAAFRPNTKVVFAETLANPSLVVLDIEKFAADCRQYFPDSDKLPSVRVRRGYRDALHHEVYGRSRGGGRRGYSRQRKFRLDGSRGQVSGSLHSGRLLSRRHVREGFRQGGLHNEGDRAADARPRLNTGSAEFVHPESRARDAGAQGRKTLLQRSEGRGVPR